MAVTTSNVTQIGMLVTGGSYRNPDLLADMARTLDQRFVPRTMSSTGGAQNWAEILGRSNAQYGSTEPNRT